MSKYKRAFNKIIKILTYDFTFLLEKEIRLISKLIKGYESIMQIIENANWDYRVIDFEEILEILAELNS